MQAEEASASLEASQKADEEHRQDVSQQLKEHAAHAEELSSALEQAKAALSSQQTEALSQLQAETQRQSQELQQRMQELQDQVCTPGSCIPELCFGAGTRFHWEYVYLWPGMP